MEADRFMRERVLGMVPQQHPFRFIEEILELDEQHCRGGLPVPERRIFLPGPFPGAPHHPGGHPHRDDGADGRRGLRPLPVAASPGKGKRWIEDNVTLFTLAENVEFTGVVSPGELVMITGRKVYFRGNQIKVDCLHDAARRRGGLLRHPGRKRGPAGGVRKKEGTASGGQRGEPDGGGEVMRRRVVITGMGVVAPNGHGLEAFEKALREGISGIRHIPELAELNFACQVGGSRRISMPSAAAISIPKNSMSLNDNIGYASVAAVDAWTDAGFTVPEAEDDRVDWETGVIAGSGIGGMDTIARQVVPMVNAGNVRRMGSRIVEQVMNSGTSARIAGLLALGNQVTSNSSACSTGNEAVIEAVGAHPGRARHADAGRRLGRGVALHLGRLRRDARDLPEVQRPAGAGLPADERERLRVSSPGRAARSSCWKSWNRPWRGGRGSTPRSWAGW